MGKKLTNGQFQVYSVTKRKFVPAEDSKIVKFTDPQWMLKYTFFTHRTLARKGEYTLSESVSGGAVVSGLETLEKATVAGFEKLKVVGEDGLKMAIQEAKQTQKQHGNKT